MKTISLGILLALFSAPALAYVGPGLGMGVIGTIFGVLAAIVLAVFGLFWYPMKRALNKKKVGANQAGHPSDSASNENAASPADASATTVEQRLDSQTGTHMNDALETPDAASRNDSSAR